MSEPADFKRQIEELTVKAREICHEVNQPLTVLLTRCQLLQMMPAVGEKEARAYSQIEEQASRVASLVGSLSQLLKSYPRE